MKLLSIALVVATAFSVANAEVICKSGLDLASPVTDRAPNPYYADEYKRKMGSYQTITEFDYFDMEQDRFKETVSLEGFPLPNLNKSMYLIDVLTGQNINPLTWEYCTNTEDASAPFLRFTSHLTARAVRLGTNDVRLNSYSIVAVNYAPIDGVVAQDEDPIHYRNDRDIVARERAERRAAIDSLSYRHDRDTNATERDDNVNYYSRKERIEYCVDPLGYGKRKGKNCK